MDNQKRTQWCRVLRIAYEKPLSRRWRKDEVSVFPGWLFDASVTVTCAALALHHFFGVAGVIAALPISISLFLVMDNKKRSATKAEEKPASLPETLAAKDAATAPKRQPLRVIRIKDCSVSIWSREATVGGVPTTFYSVNFERSFKDKYGSWRYTPSFDPDSLGTIVALAQQASEVLQTLQQ